MTNVVGNGRLSPMITLADVRREAGVAGPAFRRELASPRGRETFRAFRQRGVPEDQAKAAVLAAMIGRAAFDAAMAAASGRGRQDPAR